MVRPSTDRIRASILESESTPDGRTKSVEIDTSPSALLRRWRRIFPLTRTYRCMRLVVLSRRTTRRRVPVRGSRRYMSAPPRATPPMNIIPSSTERFGGRDGKCSVVCIHSLINKDLAWVLVWADKPIGAMSEKRRWTSGESGSAEDEGCTGSC